MKLQTVRLAELDDLGVLPAEVAQLEVPVGVLWGSQLCDRVDLNTHVGFVIFAVIGIFSWLAVDLSSLTVMQFNSVGSSRLVSESTQQFIDIMSFVWDRLFSTDLDWSIAIDSILEELIEAGFPEDLVRDGYWQELFWEIRLGDIARDSVE